MTTKRQIKALFHPLLERHSDLTVIETEYGDKVVLRPVNHLIRGICVLRTAYADYPNYFWSIGYTFDPRASAQNGICGTSFVTPDIKEAYWSHPRHQAAFMEVVEADILPILRSIDTIDKMLSFDHPMDVRWKHWFDVELHKLRLHAALGDFQTATEAVMEMKARGPHHLPWWSVESYAETMELLWPCIQTNDRAGTAALLRQWEEDFIIRNRLEAIYERTPFPLELQP